MKKKLLALFLAVAMLICAPTFFALAENSEPSRVINVVYDDSGSMISAVNDTWCQAKYAMEVFAAMLGTNDKMNIYVMSDFENGTGAGPKLSLSGSSGAGSNVASIHNMLTRAGNTPFDTVRKAYSDLAAVTADDKWLVVLTDGEFQGIDDINAFFDAKAANIQVMFLGMGPDADAIKANNGKRIYFEKADTSSQILSKITGMCTRIFNRDKLEVNVTTNTFSFDVPMSELIVFAQGANVSINGIKTSSGNLIKSAAPVSVRYSEVAATNKADGKIAKNLVGIIAGFDADFVVGDYTVDITGAETIEIYYKPNVDVHAYLSDTSGNEVPIKNKMPAGEYIINFGFVKKGTDEKVPQSELLKTVTYAATIQNNGDTKEYLPGDKIDVKEGKLSISAKAQYLDYNYVTTEYEDLDVIRPKQILFEIQTNPTYKIIKEGFENGDQPIILKALIENSGGEFVEFNEEQWAKMGVPEITFDKEAKIGSFTVEKSSTPGIFNIYPSVYNNDPASHGIGNFDIEIKHSQIIGEDGSWSGKTNATTRVEDGFSWLDRNLKTLLIVIGSLLFILLIIWIMTRKVYPKKFRVQEVSFIVNRREMPVNDIKNCCKLDAKRGFLSGIIHLFVSEKQATITVDKPPGYNEQNLRCQTRIRVCPASRRITPSRMRKFEICAPLNTTQFVREAQVGTIYERHPAGNYLVPTANVANENFQNIQISKETEFNNLELTIGATSRLEIKMRKF